MKENFIGSDIEIFLYNTKEKKFVPGIGLIGHGKYDPLQLDKIGCCIQEDGVAFEFNVCPTTKPEDMYMDIEYCIAELKKRLPENVELVIVSSARFDKEVFEHPQAAELGCEPDFNAWDNGNENQKPLLNEDTFTLRTTGGHVHVSLEESLMLKQCQVIRAMDFFLGLPSLLLDDDTERRKLYGKAGAFRKPYYGVEYRSLSNFWMKNKNLVEWVFNGVTKALDLVRSDTPLSKFIGGDEEIIRDIINTNNKDLALKFCKEYDLLPSVNITIDNELLVEVF